MSFPRYPKYKDSGVAWLGEVPEHWELIPLWSLFRRVKRTGFEGAELLSVYRDYGVIPKSSRNDNFNNPSEDLSSYQLVKQTDLVINKMKAWQGSVAISEYDGIVSPAYHVYTAQHSQNERYLHYLFRSKQYIAGYLLNSKGIRINQWDLEPQQHSRMSVTLPPLDEQTRIAEFLDRETGRMDALIEEQKRLIELLKEKRQALISHVVTKGLNPDAPMKDSGVEWLGKIPKHWEVCSTKWISPVLRGASPRPIDDPVFFDNDGEFGWVRISDVTASEKGLLVQTEERLSSLGASHSVKLKENQLFLSIAGSVGKPCITKIKVCIHDGFVYFPSLSINPQFLFRVYEAGLCFGGLGKHGTQLNLNTDTVGAIKIPIPPDEDVLEILHYLDNATAQMDALTREAEKAIELMQERRSALISAAVTGKIDLRKSGIFETE